jgi:hypothetical protein
VVEQEFLHRLCFRLTSGRWTVIRALGRSGFAGEICWCCNNYYWNVFWSFKKRTFPVPIEVSIQIDTRTVFLKKCWTWERSPIFAPTAVLWKVKVEIQQFESPTTVCEYSYPSGFITGRMYQSSSVTIRPISTFESASRVNLSINTSAVAGEIHSRAWIPPSIHIARLGFVEFRPIENR